MVVEMRHVLGQHSLEMAAVGDQHPVQQFAAGQFQSSVRRSRSPGPTGPKPRCMSVICGLAIGSGCSVVFVDHTAEYPVASDQAVEGQGGWPVFVAGGALAESLMRPVRIVVPGVLGQDPGGVAFVVDQDTVGALAADGTHEPLGITVRPGSSRRCLDDRDVLATEHGVEAGGELGVSVPDEKAERADPIAQIHGQVASG